MNLDISKSQESPCWFVGAMHGAGNDQMWRFIAEGIWENGYEDRYLEDVRAIKKNDRIALPLV